MEIIAGLFCSILFILLFVYINSKVSEKPVEEVIEVKKPVVNKKKTQKKPSNKKKKNMSKNTEIKIMLPIDLMNEVIFQGYVRWFFHYEKTLLNECDSKVSGSYQVRYANIRANMMVRITDRADNYLEARLNGNYDTFFNECRKFNDWMINCDIEAGRPNAWDEVVRMSEEIEMKDLIEGTTSTFVDPKMNYESRDNLVKAILTETRDHLTEYNDKIITKNLYEFGFSMEQIVKIKNDIANGVSVEDAINSISDEDILSEKDILPSDPIAESVDVDSLLEEWGLQ